MGCARRKKQECTECCDEPDGSKSTARTNGEQKNCAHQIIMELARGGQSNKIFNVNI